MGIEDEDIARVRDASDIVRVVEEYTQLKRVGRRWVGLCPFHGEKTPSFNVNQELGLYICRGCQVSGDVITFVREKEHLDFVGAVEKLAARAGITLRYTDKDEGESRKRRQQLIGAMEKAVEWYHQRLLTAPDAAAARKYLRSRGLDGEEVRRYRLGWAPDGWDELARAIKVSPDVFIEAGLGFRNRAGRVTDSFRGRVLFPIFDVNDRPVAFGGRIMPGGDGPKYKNSAESHIYAKSKTLYALNWAKADIVNANQAIVCEGYTDVIGFFAAGVPRAVATCGTALTEEHVRALKAYATRIVLAFDADAAGQNAAARFYEWERTYDLDVSVAALPDGVDPGDLARSDPEALQAAVEHAVPFLRFRLERVLAAANLASPEGRARAASAAIDVIREHPNSMVRDQYVMEVGTRTRIEADQLRAELLKPAPAPPPPKPVPTPRYDPEDDGGPDEGDPGPGGIWAGGRGRPLPVDRVPVGTPRESPELEALRLLVIRADEIEGWLRESFFADERSLAAYRALVAARAAGEDLRTALDRADPGAADLLRHVMVEDTDAEPDDVVDLLLMRAAMRTLDEFKAGVLESPDRFAEYSVDIGWVKLCIEQLREEATRIEAREQLLAWLGQDAEERE